MPLKNLRYKITQRKLENSLRILGTTTSLVDFSSNDYLGFSESKTIFSSAHQSLIDKQLFKNGSTGSRLLSGNHSLYNELEALLSQFHTSQSALVFNSGYDANLGLFSSVPQKGDVILYDELIHASIRDGIQMSHAKAYKFQHNNLSDLETKIRRHTSANSLFVVTESVFSMDGDSPDLLKLCSLCKDQNAYLIIDEAHAVGVFGPEGRGLVGHLQLERDVFARIVTFGKALGCHGAAVLGSKDLKTYLINFARSFIYTTALPPHSIATILSAYNELKTTNTIEGLHKNCEHFKSEVQRIGLESRFIKSNSAIHSCIIPGNKHVKTIARKLQEHGFDVKPILSPTVPEGEERLRFCLHSYNSSEEMTKVLELLATFV